MATSPILQDVVAYVDVWSSDKTANYSKPFVEQLQEMGAQISKTFSKQVTHVVFKNGHQATWRKAKKSNVRLVSVLWVGRCYEDAVHVDEDLFPALSDESNPVLRNKKHRCMQPKDSPEKTPDNNKRMRKKLDKLMKNLPQIQPPSTDISPIIIDEENRIVYSPAFKRSDYMAQRLIDMKEKRENLSPTASQMVESCSPTGLNPSLGSTPAVLKLKFDLSDDDSSASAAGPGYSPDKEKGRKPLNTADHVRRRPSKSSDKPRLLPCRDVPKEISSPSTCSKVKEMDDEKGNKQNKPRRISVRMKQSEKNKSVSLLGSPPQDQRFDKNKERHLYSPSPKKSEKGKSKVAKSCTVTQTYSPPQAVNSFSCLQPPATLTTVAVEPSKKTCTPPPKVPKRATQSFSALARSFTVSSDSKGVPSCSTGGDDDVFEDYFSPALHRSKVHFLPDLPVKKDISIQIPFELGSVPNKRKQRRSESIGSGSSSNKKRKLEEGQSDKQGQQQNDESNGPQSHPQQDTKESLPALESSDANIKPADRRRRQSTLPFTSTSSTANAALKKRRASSSAQPTKLTKANTESMLQKTSAARDPCDSLQSRGNERTVAAGSTEIPSEDKDNPAKKISSIPETMVNKSWGMRTLVMTSMSTEKQQTISQVVKTLGGFSIVDRVCESTTHVVSGGNRRTLNILLGIARGCWILSFEWMLWCLEQRQWIPEEPYELSDHFPAAQICRLQRHLSAGEHQQDLFQDQPAMFVSRHSQPPTQSLVELIQLCGGTVCKTVRQAGICIGKYSGRRPEGSRVLSEQWVLDSITHLKRLSFDNYDLE